MRVRGRELRYQAAIRGWDQQRLAQAAGVSQATVSRAMAGGHIHRGTLLRLARALHEQEPLAELKTLVDVDEAA
jgi:transcriptional regulator with XRE-family HTH domain